MLIYEIFFCTEVVDHTISEKIIKVIKNLTPPSIWTNNFEVFCQAQTGESCGSRSGFYQFMIFREIIVKNKSICDKNLCYPLI